MSTFHLVRRVLSRCTLGLVLVTPATAVAQDKAPLGQRAAALLGRFAAEPTEGTGEDPVRQLQTDAITAGAAPWGYWGSDPGRYASWTSHSNRLIPVYTFGATLESLRQEGSAYASEERIRQLYGQVPEGTLNPQATYFDQTDVYRLQKQALEAGKKHIVLIVFDGMDWQTTRAAAIYAAGKGSYRDGRGQGLAFQDYRGTATDFGYVVTSPQRGDADLDVDAQVVLNAAAEATGGYDARLGGETPWDTPGSRDYLMGLDRNQPHTVTDSASSATSLTSGIKTYNKAINVSADGQQVEPIARWAQRELGYAIGVVSSVPISHATPAGAYANNVSRDDYQDLSRDLVGLRSVSHRGEPLPGADVVIGGGWGEIAKAGADQGANFQRGNKYIVEADMNHIRRENGGPYVVAQRTAGKSGAEVLRAAADQAIAGSHRLFGLFGADGGHLPFQTADGRYNPTLGVNGRESYSPADVSENPTLADITRETLRVLEQDPEGFWLMIEAGDVDWANHSDNIDNSIGAVLSGDDAFRAVVEWVEAREGWDDTVVILTADHGHYFNLTDPSVLTNGQQ